jgi:hypothetical protein
MPRKVFVAGEILTAADVNTNLMDQAVMSFAGTAARGSAIPTPVEGMVTYLNDLDRLEVYTNAWKPVGSVLQVLSTTKNDTFSTASTTYTAVTGLAVSITPSANSSKILVMVTVGAFGNSTANTATLVRVMRDSTAVLPPSGGTFPSSFNTERNGANESNPGSITLLDSPNSTSSISYNVEMRVASGTGFINRLPGNADYTTVSTITVMEVAG